MENELKIDTTEKITININTITGSFLRCKK